MTPAKIVLLIFLVISLVPLVCAEADDETCMDDGSMDSDVYMTDDGGYMTDLGDGQYMNSDGSMVQTESLGDGDYMTSGDEVIEGMGDGDYMESDGTVMRGDD